jgi:hypothetical protein
MTRLQELSRLPCPKQVQAFEQWRKQYEAIVGDERAKPKPAFLPWALLTQELLSPAATERYTYKIAEANAYSFVAQAAYAIERHRRDHQGDLPPHAG